MIQKVASKGLNTTKQILKYAQNSNKINNVLEKEANAIKKNLEFPKLKRFLEEAKNAIKTIINKLKGTKELTKGNKLQIAKDNADNIAIREAKELLRNSDLPSSLKSDIERELKYAIETSNGEDFSCSGLIALKQANLKAKQMLEKKISCKGRLDDFDLQNNIEKHLSNEDGIHIRDKFTDWQHGKNLDDMPQIIEDAGTNMHGIEFKTRDINSISGHIGDDVQHHTESSLLEALEKNQAKRNQIEQQVDDILGHNHLDDIDDIPDSFFD